MDLPRMKSNTTVQNTSNENCKARRPIYWPRCKTILVPGASRCNKLSSKHRGKTHCARVRIWASGYTHFRLCLKSNANRIKSRTAKFENKKSKFAWEGRSKISLVAKFILRLIFKRLHPRVSCLHPQRKMREFRARWRSARANFFHAVLLVALVLLCDSVAVKCGKANKTSRKCDRQLPNFKKVLQFAVSTETKYGGATTGARYY